MKLRIFILLVVPFLSMGAGDINLGKQKSSTCIACHGLDGNSLVGLWPSLAGQNENYLNKQLLLMKEGERPVIEMTGLLDGMNDQDLKDISAYYSSQKNRIGQVSKESFDKGFELYYAGSFEKGIPACTACHSPKGQGNSPAGYPLLSGQQPEYIIKTLKDYRRGSRSDSEFSQIMVSIAYKLDDSEIEALASFINGLY